MHFLSSDPTSGLVKKFKENNMAAMVTILDAVSSKFERIRTYPTIWCYTRLRLDLQN